MMSGTRSALVAIMSAASLASLVLPAAAGIIAFEDSPTHQVYLMPVAQAGAEALEVAAGQRVYLLPVAQAEAQVLEVAAGQRRYALATGGQASTTPGLVPI